ncbi:uncharacterized protein LOC128557676 [Mercenaria mercenaria]|uniref:uncharacterized protein LOC128557676 n=1 Tax=Mercenaria mercenaria TaxID=6596 RepID=UPI00234EBF89|nr:uncharacterized protein LOC128557676 [Mercenaria mercenaria]XP_053401563.1 uncharacterized protein LOC128557676 [Mercenaria mercenaria]
MASNGAYTPDTQYYCRYFRLLLETGPKTLRKFLMQEASKSHQTIQQFLATHQNQIMVLCQRNIINKDQYLLIFPKQPNQFDLERWDLSLLIIIIDNCCGTKNLSRKDIKLLRTERNNVCHPHKTSISVNDFQMKWAAIKTVLGKILITCNDPAFEKKTLDEINQIETDHLDLGRTIEMFHEHSKYTSEVQHLIEQLKTVKSDIEEIQLNQRISRAERMEERKKSVECFEKCIGYLRHSDNLRKDPEHDQKEHQERHIEVLYEQTKVLLSKEELFVETHQFQKAREMLHDKGCVIICGSPGEGKTVAAYELMREYSQRNGNRCIEISEPSEVHDIGPNTLTVVFIDNMFGYFSMDEKKFKSWLPVLEKLQNLVEVQAFKLIIAMDTLVLNECHKEISGYSLFENQVCLSSEQLNFLEKKKILSAVLQMSSKDKDKPTLDIQTCVQSCNSDMSFPFLCKKFVSNNNYFKERESFFRRKMLPHYNILDHLSNEKRKTLLYIWMQGGKCSFDGTSHNILNKHGLSGTGADLYNMKQNADILQGVLVRKENDCYMFISKTIYESVGIYFAEKGSCKQIISEGNLEFFTKCIRLAEYPPSENVFVVPEVELGILIERIIKDVIENKNVIEIVSHPCLTKKVLDTLFDKLNDSGRLSSFLLSERENVQGGGPFLQLALKQSLPLDSFLEKVVGRFPCKNHIIRLRRCQMCTMFEKAFNGAIYGKNPLALMTLKFVKFNERDVLLEAVKLKNVAAYQVLSHIVRNSRKTDHAYQHEALHILIETCCAGIVTFILSQGYLPCTHCLMLASQCRTTYSLLIMMLRKLKRSRKSVPIDSSMIKILRKLDDRQKKEILEIIAS